MTKPQIHFFRYFIVEIKVICSCTEHFDHKGATVIVILVWLFLMFVWLTSLANKGVLHELLVPFKFPQSETVELFF